MIRTMVMAAAIIGVTAELTLSHAGNNSPKLSAASGKDLEDRQSLQQFEIQNSSQQSTQNVRSQAEKRLEQIRKDLTRNWGG